MAVVTNSKVLLYLNCCARGCANEPICNCKLLAVGVEQLGLNIIFHIMY
uniref:Uncharacterized protein n=1 Tax=Arundo donax TaxID=35708 RepID=A0A0A9B2I3_ARUDO